MTPGTASGDRSGEWASLHPAAPSHRLPKAGGAIRGLGEQFVANPANGTRCDGVAYYYHTRGAKVLPHPAGIPHSDCPSVSLREMETPVDCFGRAMA